MTKLLELSQFIWIVTAMKMSGEAIIFNQNCIIFTRLSLLQILVRTKSHSLSLKKKLPLIFIFNCQLDERETASLMTKISLLNSSRKLHKNTIH